MVWGPRGTSTEHLNATCFKPIPQKLHPTSQRWKIRATSQRNADSSGEKKTEQKAPRIVLAIRTIIKQTLSLATTKAPILALLKWQLNGRTANQEMSTHHIRPVAKGTILQKKPVLEPRQQTDTHRGTEDRRDRTKIKDGKHRTMQMKVSRLRLKLQIKEECFHSGTAHDRQQTTRTIKFPPTSEVVWQQHPETSVNHHKLNFITNEFAIETTQKTQGLENMQLPDIASHTLPPKGLQPQKSGTTT